MVSNSTTLSLSDRLRLAQLGDPESLGILLSNCNNYMKVLSQGKLDTRVRSRVSASDVVQESLLEAHRDFSKFTGNSLAEFTGWLRAILLNNISRTVEVHLLAAKRDVRRERSLDAVSEGFNQSHSRLEFLLSDHRSSPSAHAVQHESLMQMADAIAHLPPPYNEVIVLRHIEGLPFDLVAQRLGRTVGATRMLWMRAIGRLRDAMEITKS